MNLADKHTSTSTRTSLVSPKTRSSMGAGTSKDSTDPPTQGAGAIFHTEENRSLETMITEIVSGDELKLDEARKKYKEILKPSYETILLRQFTIRDEYIAALEHKIKQQGEEYAKLRTRAVQLEDENKRLKQANQYLPVKENTRLQKQVRQPKDEPKVIIDDKLMLKEANHSGGKGSISSWFATSKDETRPNSTRTHNRVTDHQEPRYWAPPVSKPLKQVTVYRYGKNPELSQPSEEFSINITEKLKAHIINLKTQEWRPESPHQAELTRQTGNILIVFCLKTSRLGTDVDASFNRINPVVTGFSHVILVVMHHQAAHVRLTTPSADLLNYDTIKNNKIGEVVDCLFWGQQGLYISTANTEAADKVAYFIKEHLPY